jgi:hypothetical protein
MAFDLQYLEKVSQSSQLDKTYNAATGSVQSHMPQIWVFNASATAANNSTAETVAANYFDGALGYLSVGDLIWVVSNDPGYHLIWVTTNDGTHVTTTNLI